MKARTGLAKLAMAALVAMAWLSMGGAPARGEEPVRCRVEVDRGVLPAEGKQRAVVKITLDAPSPPRRTRRPPVNLSVVLDRSASMQGRKLEDAKEAAIEAVRRLDEGDVFSLVIYDHEVKTLIPAQRVVDKRSIESRIRRISSRGYTALFGGVSQGAAEVRRNPDPEYVHRILLLSDGRANVGPSTPEDLGRLGAALLKEKISVSTVGVGTDYNEDLMIRLSKESDGNAYFVESSQDLPRIFAAELGDLLSVVASQVVVEIVCPEGVRPVDIIGRQGRIRGRKAELYLNQLYGAQEKYALLEVEVDPAAPGESREIAEARVSYTDALTRKPGRAVARAEVKFSEEERAVNESANVTVQRDYHLNLNALAKDRAVSLSDKGEADEAVQELKKAGEALREAGERFRDPVLLEKAEETEEEAARIQDEGMSKTRRKALRTDSYQERHQQKKW